MGLFSFVGDILNDITGGSGAAKKSQRYALQSATKEQQYNVEAMKLQNQFQKEFAQNAHQWEVNDLMKSGYNPALTTGLGGASAGGAGGGSGADVGSATVPASGTDIISILGGIANIYNSTSATKAQNKLALADSDLKTAQTIKQIMENDVFKKFGEDTQKQILINLIKSGGQIDAQTLLTKEQQRTEWSKQSLLFFQGMNEEQKAIAQRMANEITNKDVEMLEKYHVTRREIVDFAKQGAGELIGLIKAGKFAKAAEIIKGSK